MVTYTYNISAAGASSSIQNAINNIVSELSSFPTLTRNIEILLDKGNYSGFSIPDSSLFALYNTSYKLIIKPSGKHFPIIDFNFSSPTQYIGIDIGTGNPNVVIEGVRVQYFSVGIRAGMNSHYAKVKNCIVNNNRNVGIFFDHVSEAQAIQNIIINGDYGIVNRLCKSAINIHNTIFMNGAIATEKGKSISCIWAELANDYGNGLQDKGKLYLIGNVGWNTSGRCLTLFLSDMETNGAVISDYNDWVVGKESEFICLEDNAFYRGAETRPRVIYTSLAAFKDTGKDANSISQDPRFISAVKIKSKRTGSAIDLNLLPVSPVLGLVPSYAYNTSLTVEQLPSFFDSSDIAKDILGNNRNQDITAAGANDKPSNSGFFGQDVFSDPLSEEDQKLCDKNPFANILFKNLDLWYPKLNKGYFYSNEREFYLYAKKKCSYLGELAETEIALPGSLSLKKDITVKVAGKEVSSDYFTVFQNKIKIYHKDLPISTLEEEVVIEGYITSWKEQSFNYNPVLYIKKLNEGVTKFYLPIEYVNDGPVIITDDRSCLTDKDSISNREFAVVFDLEENKSEIKFNNNVNQVVNSQFEYYISGSPLHFNNSLCQVSTAESPLFSVAGDNVCKIYNNGFLETKVQINTGEPFSFSLFSASLGSGSINWNVKYYDHDYRFLGMEHTGSYNLSNTWERKYIQFNTSVEEPIVNHENTTTSKLDSLYPPTDSTFALIKLTHVENLAYTGSAIISAVQYEQGKVPSLYNRRFYLNELTVEFETSEDDIFVDHSLLLSPTANLLSNGFLYIPEVPAKDYDGPRDIAITTLHEWRWPEGRKNILPWARTKGKDKLRKRVNNLFHKIPLKKPEIISPANLSAPLRDIEIYPTKPSTFAGDSNGVGFSIKLIDVNGNPFALAPCSISCYDTNLKYPGVLSKRYFGTKEQLGPVVGTKTDIAGNISLTWYPPNAGLYNGPLPLPTLTTINGDLVSVIDTEYPINDEVYGNVIIIDSSGNRVLTNSTEPIVGKYIPSYVEGNSVIALKYPPMAGSISVKDSNGVYYTESQVSILDTDQFFADYNSSTILLKGRIEEVEIEYIPSYVFVNSENPRKLMLYYNKIFNTSVTNIVLGYDFTVNLKIDVENIDSSIKSQEFKLLCKNSLSSRKEITNYMGLEI